MAVSLYTVRVVLDVLGEEDYGIYNVVGGFVAMFNILSGALLYDYHHAYLGRECG